MCKSNFLLPAAIIVVFASLSYSQRGNVVSIPRVYSNISASSDGRLVFVDKDGHTMLSSDRRGKYTINHMRGKIIGTEDGLMFDFADSYLDGRIYYGFAEDPGEIRFSYPVFFYKSAQIFNGKATVDIRNSMKGKYDIIGWQETGIIRLGYRIIDYTGDILYDGKIMVKDTGRFVVDTSIIEGPFINLVTDRGAVVSFETNYPIKAQVIIDNRRFADVRPDTHHEITIDGLTANKEYVYTISYGDYRDRYSFTTAPEPGSRLPLVFAYASDGRGNNGGGERYIYGTNAYIMKRIGLLCAAKKVRFLQFTGDMVDGYGSDPDEIRLQYANWKRAIDPFAHTLPVIPGMGNHEGLFHTFVLGRKKAYVDKFPFETASTEALFAENFVLPTNGPKSEDGSIYDPDPEATDFPSYEENVFFYTHDNIAMIVLNSTYWFSRALERYPETGGNLKGYIMDNQIAWLKTTLETFERDRNIDHVFVTVHTPIFPNGGHVDDDMWYEGNNRFRPVIAGKPVEKGIVERRDELLDLLMNGSSKVIAVLTGDEHNYHRLLFTEAMPIYPDDYTDEKLTKFRPIWMINNGAAGAPYYGREETPWSSHVDRFSTQNAVVFFYVDGKKVECEVINPDTMEMIDKFQL